MPERGEDLLRNRKEKLEHIRQLGLDPFPPRYQRTSTALDAVALFREEEERHGEGARTAPMSVAGRIMSMRVMGKAAFLDLRDGSGKIQAHLRRDVLGEEYQLVKDLDLGDFLGVSGRSVSHPHRRDNGRGPAAYHPGQVPETSTGEVARPAGY